jgi:hypothetical protein
MLKRFIPLVICGPLILATAACTPQQIADWVAWNERDPAAAQEFARLPEVQASLASGEHEQQASTSGLTNNHGSRWDRIAQCESGGRWDYPLVTNRTGTYSGGLMIWTKAWAAYGGHEFAPNAYQASKAQQIEIAERILADNGWGAWDCA